MKRLSRASLAAVALFLLVVAGRLAFVGLYSESVPFWDQWDAEGARLIQPWVEGKLDAAQLLAPHNEHRILWTRLIALSIFEANDRQWDNLVSACVNVFIYALVPVLLYALLGGGLRRRLSRATLFLSLLALAWLPYAYENTRIGFQNQFYLMSLLGIGCVLLASRARDNHLVPLKLLVPALASIFTMASGLLGPVAAGGVLLLRYLLRQLRLLPAVTGIALLAVIAVLAFACTPHIAGHDVFRASSFGEWFTHFLANLSWPLPAAHGHWAWLLLWSPTLIALWRLYRQRQADSQQLLALGLAAWAIMQAAAIAYSRGALSSRYLDTMAIGLVANAWLALRLAEDLHASGRTLRGIAPAAVLLASASVGLLRSTPADMRAVRELAALSTIQTFNTRAFVATGDKHFLDDQPFEHIPYPWPDRLASLLAEPALRASLPASIRQPLAQQTRDSNGSVQVHADAPVEVGRLSHLALLLQQWLRNHIHHRHIIPDQARPTLTSPVAEAPAVPLPLAPRQVMQIDWQVAKAGDLSAIALFVGNYGDTADGSLLASVCTPRSCGQAHALLADSVDNQYLDLPLDAPLATQAGDMLSISLSRQQASTALALWAKPATPGAARLRLDEAPVAPSGQALTIPLKLIFLD